MAINLKPCPFCGGKARISPDAEATRDTESKLWAFTVGCDSCCATSGLTFSPDKAIEAWSRRSTIKVETSFYDKEETFPDCTVQVLTNTATGETSVGWWKNGN